MPIDKRPDFRFKVRPKRGYVDALRPEGYGYHSSTPYFTKAYADLIKKNLDAIEHDDKNKVYSFPATAHESVHTVYAKIYYGWLYLIEIEDTPDKKYLRLRDELKVAKKRNRVVIRWCKPKSEAYLAGMKVDLPGMEVTVEEYGWRSVLRKWCEQSVEGDIEKLRINLLPEDIDWIKTFVQAWPSIVVVQCDSKGYKLTKNSKLADAIAEEQGNEL